jgi:hypothetical protein
MRGGVCAQMNFLTTRHLKFIVSNLVHRGLLESIDFGGIFGGILKNSI